VRRAFEITRLTKIFHLHETFEDALVMMRAQGKLPAE